MFIHRLLCAFFRTGRAFALDVKPRPTPCQQLFSLFLHF